MTTAVNKGSGNEKDPKKEAEAKAAEVKAEAEAKADQAKADAKDAAANLEEQAKDAAENAKAKAEELKDKVTDKAEEVKAKVDAAQEKDSAEPAAETVKTDSGVSREFEVKSALPDLDKINRRIFLGALPGLGTTYQAKRDPQSAIKVEGFTIDQENLASYADATGLRFGNELPLTYMFVGTFPLAMELISRPDAAFSPLGAVHISNVIEQTRALTVDETFDLRAYSANLRPHRRGLLIDVIIEVLPTGTDEVVWTQKSTYLGMGAKFTKDADLAVTTRAEDSGKVLPKPELPEFKPNARWKFTRDKVNSYVEASNDHNPIHTSNIGAKLFGFPAVIAHGMLSAATMLTLMEGKTPGAVRYSVEFVKPVVIPTEVAAWAIEDEEGTYSLQLRGSSKPDKLHLNAQLKPL